MGFLLSLFDTPKPQKNLNTPSTSSKYFALVEEYDGKPFDLKKEVLTREGMKIILLEGSNTSVATKNLGELNSLLTSQHYISNLQIDPQKVSTFCEHPRNKDATPDSYVELNPFTAKKHKSKYPIILHFSQMERSPHLIAPIYSGSISYIASGEIGKACVTIFKKSYSVTVKFKRDKDHLIIQRIDKLTLGIGSTCLYSK